MEKQQQFINVPRHISDPFYRYTMPTFNLKVEGRGKMIKTILLNLDDVSPALERPSEYIIKFLGFELNTPVDTKGKFSIGGERKLSEIYTALDIFIEKYVLCKKCQNPETEIGVAQNGINLKCRACGGKSKVDDDHKFYQFLLKKEMSKGGQQKTRKLDNPIDILHQLWQEKLIPSEILTQVQTLQTKQRWSNEEKLNTIFSSLFEKNVEDIEGKADILKLFVDTPKSQETILFCLDKMAAAKRSIIDAIPTILEVFYQKNLVQPEQIWKWFDQPQSRMDPKVTQAVRKNVQNFMQNIPKDE